jgi:hypothetical protein
MEMPSLYWSVQHGQAPGRYLTSKAPGSRGKRNRIGAPTGAFHGLEPRGLAHLEEARRCYQEAGLDKAWKALVAEIRRDHHRKSGFMPGFEAIVSGKRARGQWARRAKA